jgi:hypothetical protein
MLLTECTRSLDLYGVFLSERDHALTDVHLIAGTAVPDDQPFLDPISRLCERLPGFLISLDSPCAWRPYRGERIGLERRR